jgi:cell pole-organizing protein PopZ
MEEILASISRIIADDKKPAEAIPRPAGDQKTEVLELTEVVEEDGTIRRITPKAPAVPDRAEPAIPERIEPAPPRLTAAEPVPPAAGPKRDPGVRDHVLSAAAAGAAAAALGRLATSSAAGERSEDAEPQPAGSGHALEDIVRDALRPLLRSWLDAHLPALAERLAREEIARVLQEAGLR